MASISLRNVTFISIQSCNHFFAKILYWKVGPLHKVFSSTSQRFSMRYTEWNTLTFTIKHCPWLYCWFFTIWFHQTFKWSPIMITQDLFSTTLLSQRQWFTTILSGFNNALGRCHNLTINFQLLWIYVLAYHVAKQNLFLIRLRLR